MSSLTPIWLTAFHDQWLANLARLKRELPAVARLHLGHGEPAGVEILDWQEAYIRTWTHRAASA